LKGTETAFALTLALTLAAGIPGCATDTRVQTATPPAPATQAQATPAATTSAPPSAAPAPKAAVLTTTLSADESFESAKPGDRPTLTPAAKAKLDTEVIAKVTQLSRVDLVLVGGHTDRLVDIASGQQLSEQEAEAVLDYLKSRALQAAAMDTMGFGKTLPVKDCPGTMPEKELVACLAPNRRVVIEVKGLMP
jgi:OmpA-OmpF porin, OOP family